MQCKVCKFDTTSMSKLEDHLYEHIVSLREAVRLLGAAPSARLAYLESIGAKVGKEYGVETCVDEYWRKLIVDEALKK